MGEKGVQTSCLRHMYFEFPAQAPYAYSVSDTGGSEEKKLRSPPGGANLFETYLGGGGLNRDEGLRTYLRGGEDLFSLPKTMASVFHNELAFKVEKLRHKKVGGPQPRIRIKSKLQVGVLTILDQPTQNFTVVTD